MMMSTFLFRILTLSGMAVAMVAGASAQQQPVRGGVLGPDQTFRVFKRTPDGDWKTSVRQPDGTVSEFTYVPPLKIGPTVAVVLSRVPGEARFSYQYTLANRADASQDFALIWFKVANPVAIRQQPSRWTNMGPPERSGLVTWQGPIQNGLRSGVRPGETLDQFVIDSPALPGITEADCQGHPAGAIDIPPGFSEAQYAELKRVSQQATVRTPIIAPLIAAGVGETELTKGVLVSRLGGHYVSAFVRYRHPNAVALDDAFRKAYAVKPEASRAALQGVLEVAKRPVTDAWHQQMSTALAFSIQAVLDELVPNARLPQPADYGDR